MAAQPRQRFTTAGGSGSRIAETAQSSSPLAAECGLSDLPARLGQYWAHSDVGRVKSLCLPDHFSRKQ